MATERPQKSYLGRKEAKLRRHVEDILFDAENDLRVCHEGGYHDLAQTVVRFAALVSAASKCARAVLVVRDVLAHDRYPEDEPGPEKDIP